MKVLHTADLHHDLLATRLGKWKIAYGENLIYKERLERTREIIYAGIRAKVDVFVIAGDLFNRSKPFPQEYDDINHILDLIPEEKAIIITPGNHDEFTSRGCAQQPLKGRWSNVFVCLGLETIHIQGYDFIVAPWQTPIEDIRYIRSTYPIGVKPILVHHCGTEVKGQHWTEIADEIGTVSLDELQALECRAVMLGHYHGQTELTPGIWYCGSPEVYNFGERAQEKGFLIWDFFHPMIDGSTFAIKKVKTEFPEYFCITPEKFLELTINQPVNTWDAYLMIQGEVTEEQRALIFERLKKIDFGEFDYKLDLKSAMKERAVVGVTGKTNKEILISYLKGKNIEPTEEILSLDSGIG